MRHKHNVLRFRLVPNPFGLAVKQIGKALAVKLRVRQHHNCEGLHIIIFARAAEQEGTVRVKADSSISLFIEDIEIACVTLPAN